MRVRPAARGGLCAPDRPNNQSRRSRAPRDASARARAHAGVVERQRIRCGLCVRELRVLDVRDLVLRDAALVRSRVAGKRGRGRAFHRIRVRGIARICDEDPVHRRRFRGTRETARWLRGRPRGGTARESLAASPARSRASAGSRRPRAVRGRGAGPRISRRRSAAFRRTRLRARVLPPRASARWPRAALKPRRVPTFLATAARATAKRPAGRRRPGARTRSKGPTTRRPRVIRGRTGSASSPASH